jgi:hypothetical protein
MDKDITALERAFQLAKTGQYANVQLIKRQLHREGYDQRQVEGPALLSQLSSLIRAARKCAQRT